MSSTDLVLHILELFDKFSIPYMLVGAYASNYYGRPRMTSDADFVVAIQDHQLRQLLSAMGPDYRLNPQMAFEAVTMTTYHVIVHRATAFKIELFVLTDDPHNQVEFQRRRQVDFEGHPTWLPSPEDVIIQKLRWSSGPNREQDLPDATQVLRVQRSLGLDFAYIRHWCAQHGTLELLEKTLQSLPPLPPQISI
jgi:hypothetical protein